MKNNSNFKVVVSDEIFDFRTLQNKKQRPKSQETNQKTDQKDSETDKISTTFNSNLLTQQKIRKTRSKGRSKTVDPRFRSCRSPEYQLNSSQSTNTLNRLHNSSKANKGLFLSSPSVKSASNDCMEKYNESTPKEGPHLQSMTEKGRSFIEGNSADPLKRNNEEDLLLLRTKEDSFNREPKPRVSWGDVEELGSLNTINPSNSEDVKPGTVLCARCRNECGNFPVYRYDDITERYTSVSEDTEVQTQFCSEDNSVMYPYLIACSIVGLIFGSLLIWLLHLQFPLIFNKQPPDGYISFYIKYLKGIFSKLFKNTWETFYRVLTIQRSELFPKKEVPRYNVWFW